MPNLISLLANNPQFTTLANALTVAGMVDTLGGSGPFTLFAPTNEAFHQLPTELMTYLRTRDGRERLTGLLTTHVIAGNLPPSDLTDGSRLPAINGQWLTIHAVKPVIQVNGVPVFATLRASNGFIYAVDALLVPVVSPPTA